LPDLFEQSPALAALRKRQKRGLVLAWQTASEPEHLPLRTTKERRRCQVDDHHNL